jgi:hypothetical protein
MHTKPCGVLVETFGLYPQPCGVQIKTFGEGK